jgi:TRAP-type C4-dicarboxylate transport system permease small subunit
MNRIIHYLSSFNTGLTYLGGWLLFGMMIVLIVDVVARVLFTPLHAMVELSVIAMMIIVYLGLSACEEHGDHVQLEFLSASLPPKLAKIVNGVVSVLNTLAIMVLAYAIILSAIVAYQRNEATMGNVTILLWPVKFIMVIGVVAFVIQSIVKPFDKRNHNEDGAIEL